MNELEEMRQRLFDYERKMLEARDRNARWQAAVKAVEERLCQYADFMDITRELSGCFEAMRTGSLEDLEKALKIEVK